MFRRVIVSVIAFLALTSFKPKPLAKSEEKTIPLEKISAIYNEIQLGKYGLSQYVFKCAVNGWNKLVQTNKVQSNIIAVCDFSQSSNTKRLYIFDLAERKLLFHSLVAHGKNTGEEFALNFSNEPSTYKSSLGFYVTKDTYYGSHGLSLKLEGLERGFNHNAADRAIVIHGAEYVSESFIKEHGRLGRSFGCPSLPVELTEPIIETIKDGTCLFIYYPDKRYLKSSVLLR